MVFQLGDLPAGETRDLMIPIRVTTRGEGSIAELAQVTLHFEDVIGKSGVRERGAFVSVKTSRDTKALAGAVKIDLEVARIRSAAAATILQALALARSGQLPAAHQSLAAATTAVKVAAKTYKNAGLDELLRQLADLDHEIAQIVVNLASPRPDQNVPSAAPAAVESQPRRAVPKTRRVA